MKPRYTLWIIIVLVLVSIYIDLPKLSFNATIPSWQSNFPKPFPQISVPFGGQNVGSLLGVVPLKLGLDLQGGSQLVLETQMEKIDNSQKDQALDSAREVIERRVNLYGVSESVVQTSKVGDSRRILVDLPGIKDASEAAALVGKTAQLEFRELAVNPESTEAALFIDYENTQSIGLTGADLKKAEVVFNQSAGGSQGSPQVSVVFTDEGAQKFAEVTKRNVGKPLPIFLDNVLLSAPTVQQEIIGGNAVITGNYTVDEAKNFSIQLNAGALPVPIKIIEQRSIGATLGDESVQKSLVAGIIGLLTVIIYMILYYGRLGVISSLALITYTLFSLAIFKTGLFILPPVTLTLAGIAGFILSIGMAVDANILIFERMKEERRWGRNEKMAIDLGFKRAWSSIRDSNISSLITAGILFYIGTGPVRGFALTLAIGVMVSMFTAITVTRTLLKVFSRN